MDAAEFDAFHAGSYPRLVTALVDVTGDPDRAQRAVEEAYARAWARRRRLGRDVPAELWVRDAALRLSGTGPGDGNRAEAGLEDLEATMAALPRQPLPAAEIRRRGDARARARAAGWTVVTSVAAVAVVAGLVLLAPGGAGAGPGPPEQLMIQEDEPFPDRPSSIPADFDLASGLSQIAQPSAEPGYDALAGRLVCGRPYALGGLTTEPLSVRVTSEGSDTVRVLAVARELDLSDADRNAHGIAERYVSRFSACPEEESDGMTVRTSVERVWIGDEGWVVLREVDRGDPLEIVQVVRVGSAVLVSSTTISGVGTALSPSLRRAQSYSVAPVVDQMCLWDEGGCPS